MFPRYELAARADADDLAKAIAEIPSCALPCLATSAASVNCGANDFACQCKNPPDFGVGSSTTACVVKACNLIDSTATGISFGRVCIIVRRSPDSTSLSSTTSSSTPPPETTTVAPVTTTTSTTTSPISPPPAVAASTSEVLSSSSTLPSSTIARETTVSSSSSSVLETISSTTSQLVSSSSLTSIQETSLAITSPTSTASTSSSSQSTSPTSTGTSQAQVNNNSNTTNRVVVPVVVAAAVAFVTAIIIVLSVIWLRKRHSKKANEDQPRNIVVDTEKKGGPMPSQDMGELYLANTTDSPPNHGAVIMRGAQTTPPRGRSTMPRSIHSDNSKENLLITEAALLGNIRTRDQEEEHDDNDDDDNNNGDFMSDEDMKRTTRLHSEWFIPPPSLSSHPVEKPYISPERERTTHIAETLHHPGMDQVPPLSPATTVATTNSITDSEYGKIGAAITAYMLTQPPDTPKQPPQHSRFSISTVNTSVPAGQP